MSSQTEIPYQALHQINSSTVTRTGTGTAGHSPIPVDIAATVTMIPTEDIPGHIIETIDVTTGVLHDALTPVLIFPTVTPDIADNLHTGAHQLILRTKADHDHIQHKNQVRKPCINLQCVPAELKINHMIKRNPRVMTDDPQTNFHSSNDISSDSEDDPDHLN